MSNNSKSEKSLTEFLIEDFKDTSAKLESTDKKIQFFVQIYMALLSAILSASIFFLAKHFDEIGKVLNNGLKTDNIIFLIFEIVLLFLLGFGLCVYWYIIKGNYIHAIYLNRMNFLRNTIFKKNGFNPEQIENYYYTKKSIVKVGMGNVLNQLIAFTIILNIIILINFLFKTIFYYYCILVIPLVLVIINLSHYFIIEHYKNKANKAIDKGWEKETNEIR